MKIFEFKRNQMDTMENKIADLNSSEVFGDWIPRNVVQNFFNYGNTKMSTFATDYNIRMSKVGKRIFYKYSDVVRLINEGLKDYN